MKSIVTVNTVLPTVENNIEYNSGESLRDYDIAIFDPEFPYESRIDFTGGGSCISIEGGQRLQAAINHWSIELRCALEAGKTIFILLNEYKTDTAAGGSTYNKGQRLYNIFTLDNYQVLPFKITLKNTKGRQILIANGNYRGLHEAIKDIAQYRVIFTSEIGEKIFTTKDGAVIAAVAKKENLPGNIVFLPYFNLEEFDEDNPEWSDTALKISKGVVSQLVAIDKVLRQKGDQSPAPEWLENLKKPMKISHIDATVNDIEAKIQLLEKQKKAELESKDDLSEFSHLLYENGRNLESAIEKSLELIGYNVENYRAGDLEIDHVITSPEGFRMIGESEGKDNSAIDISKFRQLESNINEDFNRDGIDVPAKGILFGNGYRFTAPSEREEQFTQKCLINAKRLGTSVIRTSDLYEAVVYILDHPNDKVFKSVCRQVIENTVGEIVKFPSSKRSTTAKSTQKKKTS